MPAIAAPSHQEPERGRYCVRKNEDDPGIWTSSVRVENNERCLAICWKDPSAHIQKLLLAFKISPIIGYIGEGIGDLVEML
jgi:hypothetical protein